MPILFFCMLECMVFEPLVKVLRLADGDGQSMAYMYGEIIEAKKEIMIAVENSKKDYKVITTAMESKMNGRLDTPLHMASYALNPYYSYAATSIFSDVEVMSGLMEVIEQFYHDDDDESINKVLNIELPKFKKMEGMFGKVAAKKAISNAHFNAGEWWATYGLQTPTLIHMALRILNLTTSSSGCERNWSVFEQVDAKRRNKLDIRRRDDLVYIQFNGGMMDKRIKYESSCDVLAKDASMAQDWICEGAYVDDNVDPITGLAKSIDDAMEATEDTEPRRSARVRELHEVEEFVSDKEEEEHVLVNEDEIEFESDDERVLQTNDNGDEED